MVIRDPDSLSLVILNEEAALEISVTDDQWHHLAVSWSAQNGKYLGYKDGMKVAEGTLKKGNVMCFFSFRFLF